MGTHGSGQVGPRPGELLGAVYILTQVGEFGAQVSHHGALGGRRCMGW